MKILTACDVHDPVSGEGLDQLWLELVVGVAVTQPAVSAFAPSVQFTGPGDGGRVGTSTAHAYDVAACKHKQWLDISFGEVVMLIGWN